ncbi:hypothetical protein ACFB49_41810 [Sphingomonas sp. DBB INV C78]|uniref:hypothetical protein n=1 Tax=Sphingomonas sp. DBB INV C78 TaxID=3349434 RepID=UPI0036D27692
MRGARIVGTTAALVATACGTGASQTTTAAPTVPDQGIMVDDRPQGPESHLGAHKVVVDYYALLADRRYADAWKLWADNGKASGQTADQFAASFANVTRYEPKVGGIGPMEGAAGSVFITVFVDVNGARTDGTPIHQKGWVSLRRVNNVPGATPEQLAWRITKVPI